LIDGRGKSPSGGTSYILLNFNNKMIKCAIVRYYKLPLFILSTYILLNKFHTLGIHVLLLV